MVMGNGLPDVSALASSLHCYQTDYVMYFGFLPVHHALVMLFD